MVFCQPLDLAVRMLPQKPRNIAQRPARRLNEERGSIREFPPLLLREILANCLTFTQTVVNGGEGDLLRLAIRVVH